MKTVKLKDISINNRGYYGIGASAVDYDENKFTYLRITDINDDGSLNKNGLMSVDDEKSDQYLLEKNDIVFARTGASTGRNYFYDGEINNMVYAGFLIKFSLNPELVNPKFVKYYCLSQKYKDWISSSLTGSTRPNINEKQLSEMPIELPDRFYQDKVVEILDSIAQKIQLNNKTNNNLLELSIGKIQNTSFDNYENLSDLSEIISKGTTPTTGDMKQFENRNIKFIKVRNFTGYYINKKELEFIPKEIHDGKLKRSILKENDLLISIAGTLGKVAYVDSELDNSNTNQAVAFIRLKDILNMGYLYFYLQTKKVQMEINEKQVHAVQPNFSLGMLGQIEVPILMDDEKKKYNDILNVIKNNVHQNEKLEQLRDTLLPKLMNGEINLDNIEI